ncbi:putative inactive protein kinase-like [Capsicum annuum]|nr:putative inactive protein kinase-like [Capsicum annuum]
MQKSSTVDYVIYQSATLFGDATDFLPLIYVKQEYKQFSDATCAQVHEATDLDISKSFKLTDRSLYALAHNCPNLTKLNISGCSTFNDGAIANLAEHCRNLSVLNLFGCIKAITDKPLKLNVLTSQMTTKMTLTTPYRLLVITITECTLHVNLGWYDKVGDEGVMSLAYRCPNLRALDQRGCLLKKEQQKLQRKWDKRPRTLHRQYKAKCRKGNKLISFNDVKLAL